MGDNAMALGLMNAIQGWAGVTLLERGDMVALMVDTPPADIR